MPALGVSVSVCLRPLCLCDCSTCVCLSLSVCAQAWVCEWMGVWGRVVHCTYWDNHW